MSQIYFDEYYILVIPSYTSTNVHKHSMQHLFWGKEKLYIKTDAMPSKERTEKNTAAMFS